MNDFMSWTDGSMGDIDTDFANDTANATNCTGFVDEWINADGSLNEALFAEPLMFGWNVTEHFNATGGPDGIGAWNETALEEAICGNWNNTINYDYDVTDEPDFVPHHPDGERVDEMNGHTFSGMCNNAATPGDEFGDGCAAYEGTPSWCGGSYDTDEFNDIECCACSAYYGRE